MGWGRIFIILCRTVEILMVLARTLDIPDRIFGAVGDFGQDVDVFCKGCCYFGQDFCDVDGFWVGFC